ncbi:MAG: HAMP domain-containing sensor histidine kinase [Pirellulales bacterium]
MRTRWLHSLRGRLAAGFGLLMLAIGIGGRLIHYELTVEFLARDLDSQLRARLEMLEADRRVAAAPDAPTGGARALADIHLASDRRPSLLLWLFMPAEAHSGLAESDVRWFSSAWDADGRLVASTDLPPAFSWDPRWLEKIGRIWTDDDRGLRLAAYRGEADPLLLVGTSLDVLRAAEQQARLFYLSTLAVVLPMLLGALWWMLGRLLQPLQAITRTADRIRRGRFDERIDLTVADEEIAGMAATINAMLDRLEEARDKQSRFNADLAHEVLGPVHAILLEADSALQREPAEKDAERLATIRSRAARIETLCEALLTYSRSLAVGSTGLAEIDLEPVVDMAAEQAAQAAAERNVVIRNDVGSVVVRGQPDLLQQVFTNLLNNAIGHSPPGSEVRVEAEAGPAGCEVRVVDRGSGVSGEHTARIFDRFFSASAADASGRSHGVGLSLSREIMRSHGGDIDLVPTPGGGATFVARFPARLGADR